jgi:hypothetical protein
VPAILVGGAQLERGDQFAVPFQFHRRQDAGFAVIGAMRRVRPSAILEGAINGGR